MPAGPIGGCWLSGSWADTAWEAGSWSEAVEPVDYPAVIRLAQIRAGAPAARGAFAASSGVSAAMGRAGAVTGVSGRSSSIQVE